MPKNYFLTILICLFCACTTENHIDLEHQIKGKGATTIIFENGMASTFETWKNIPDRVSKSHRILIYNRSGLGNSAIQPQPRTTPNMVADLDQLLKTKDIKGPYILVAHSMGSYLSRYFALQHPEKVKGILLIDPSPDQMYDQYTPKETEDFLNFGNENFKNSNESVKQEWENYLPNRTYIQKPLSDDFPVVILSATQWDFYEYHKSILNHHPKSKHLKIEGSHDLHHEQPALIMDQIEYLLHSN